MASSVPFSDEARAILRPNVTYRELAALEPQSDTRVLVQKILFVLLVIGAFVSLTASGRLVLAHVGGTMLFWSFAPVVQMAAVTLALRVFAPRFPWARGLWMYFVGHGPWMLLLVALAGVCVFAPSVYTAMLWLLSTFILPGVFLVTIAWSGRLTYAFFRSGVALSRGRAAGATALYYVAYVALVLGWYFATNQIQPQLFGVPA